MLDLSLPDNASLTKEQSEKALIFALEVLEKIAPFAKEFALSSSGKTDEEIQKMISMLLIRIFIENVVFFLQNLSIPNDEIRTHIQTFTEKSLAQNHKIQRPAPRNN